jgi:hypothetical protein
MSRRSRLLGALSPAVVLSLSTTAGPALEKGTDPTATTSSEPPPPTTSVPVPTPAAPAVPEATAAQPSAPPSKAADERPDLRISVVFDKPAYFSHERIVARATVVNAGTAPALQVKVASVGNTSNNNAEPLGSSGAGVRLEPGETAVGVLSANPTELDGGFVRLEAHASSLLEDANPADNVVTVSVPVTEVFGTITRRSR